MYQRWQKRNIERMRKVRRVLLLVGARQCGKSTLAKELVDSNVEYFNLDNPAIYLAAEDNPVQFVQHTKEMMIIDEIQRVPNLLLAVKMAVDKDNKPGQYLITGSANVQSLPTVRESLAGRVTKIRLRPLTQGEIVGKQPDFLQKAFSPSPELREIKCDRDQILDMAFKGGFPEPLSLFKEDREQWYKDYIDTLIDRDLKDIFTIHHQNVMRQLIRALAGWSGKALNTSEIQASLAISRPTLESYINMLEALYLVERVQPWFTTDYARVGKHPKLFMVDCGLMRSLLDWQFDQIRADSDRAGKLLETFVFNELAAQVDVYNYDYKLYYYRDREQREIDFLIERKDGALVGIEVKAASSPNRKDFTHMRWFQKNIAKDRPFTGILLYTGQLAASYGENMFAVPMGMLWGMGE